MESDTTKFTSISPTIAPTVTHYATEKHKYFADTNQAINLVSFMINFALSSAKTNCFAGCEAII